DPKRRGSKGEQMRATNSSTSIRASRSPSGTSASVWCVDCVSPKPGRRASGSIEPFRRCGKQIISSVAFAGQRHRLSLPPFRHEYDERLRSRRVLQADSLRRPALADAGHTARDSCIASGGDTFRKLESLVEATGLTRHTVSAVEVDRGETGRLLLRAESTLQAGARIAAIS